MSNAGLDESAEEVQEIDIAEIKKLKVRYLDLTATITIPYIRYKNCAQD